MKKRVLLIGDALQAGYSSVSPLMKEYQLRVFMNRPHKLYNEDNIECFYGSLNNYEDVIYAITGCDIVVISNTISRSGAPVEGVDNIKRAIAQLGVKRVIYAPAAKSKSGAPIIATEDSAAFNHWG